VTSDFDYDRDDDSIDFREHPRYLKPKQRHRERDESPYPAGA
jgi:hypothetical protein